MKNLRLNPQKAQKTENFDAEILLSLYREGIGSGVFRGLLQGRTNHSLVQLTYSARQRQPSVFTTPKKAQP